MDFIINNIWVCLQNITGFEFLNNGTDRQPAWAICDAKSNCVMQNQIVLCKIKLCYAKSYCVMQNQTVFCKIKLCYAKSWDIAWVVAIQNFFLNYDPNR